MSSSVAPSIVPRFSCLCLLPPNSIVFVCLPFDRSPFQLSLPVLSNIHVRNLPTHLSLSVVSNIHVCRLFDRLPIQLFLSVASRPRPLLTQLPLYVASRLRPIQLSLSLAENSCIKWDQILIKHKHNDSLVDSNKHFIT